MTTGYNIGFSLIQIYNIIHQTATYNRKRNSRHLEWRDTKPITNSTPNMEKNKITNPLPRPLKASTALKM